MLGSLSVKINLQDILSLPLESLIKFFNSLTLTRKSVGMLTPSFNVNTQLNSSPSTAARILILSDPVSTFSVA